jgi:hypothetical protein
VCSGLIFSGYSNHPTSVHNEPTFTVTTTASVVTIIREVILEANDATAITLPSFAIRASAVEVVLVQVSCAFVSLSELFKSRPE